MAEPGKPQSTQKQDDGKTKVSDPTKSHTENDTPPEISAAERHGVPKELQQAKDGDEAISKSLPTSDRENAETAVAKQKPEGS